MGNAIFRRRGDTYAIELTVTNQAGVPQNISGKRYVLTANSVENPEDASSELFQLVGEITDYENGEVEFPMTDEQANHVGHFHYDVEETDDGPWIWTPDASATDDDPFPIDGSDYLAMARYDPGSMVYDTIDGRRVIRSDGFTSFGSWSYHLLAADLNRYFFDREMQFELTAYMEKAEMILDILDASTTSYYEARLNMKAAPTLALYAQVPDTDGLIIGPTIPAIDPAAWVAGWYVFGFKRLADGKFEMKVHPEDSPSSYVPFDYGVSVLNDVALLTFDAIISVADDPAAVIAISRIEWNRL